MKTETLQRVYEVGERYWNEVPSARDEIVAEMTSALRVALHWALGQRNVGNNGEVWWFAYGAGGPDARDEPNERWDYAMVDDQWIEDLGVVERSNVTLHQFRGTASVRFFEKADIADGVPQRPRDEAVWEWRDAEVTHVPE